MINRKQRWFRVETWGRGEPDYVLVPEAARPGVHVVLSFDRYEHTYRGSISDQYAVIFIGPSGTHTLAREGAPNTWAKATAKEKGDSLSLDADWLRSVGVIGGGEEEK